MWSCASRRTTAAIRASVRGALSVSLLSFMVSTDRIAQPKVRVATLVAAARTWVVVGVAVRRAVDVADGVALAGGDRITVAVVVTVALTAVVTVIVVVGLIFVAAVVAVADGTASRTCEAGMATPFRAGHAAPAASTISRTR
jgi:hypothetical protein